MGRVTVVVVASARQRLLCRSLLHAEDDPAIIGEGRTVREALELTAERQPAVLLLGGPPARAASPLALAAIRRQSPGTRVMLLTAGPIADAALLAAINGGARGWLDEAAARRFLGKAVRAVACGEAWVPRRMAPEILKILEAGADALRQKPSEPCLLARKVVRRGRGAPGETRSCSRGSSSGGPGQAFGGP
jgi:DNA-binding NarL/FixJ family response regulator